MNKSLLVICLLVSVAASAQDQPQPPPEGGGGMDDLRKEYDRIREALFASRARAAAVGAALYSSKVQLYLHYGSPRFYHVSRATLRLDGASVFEDQNGQVGNDDAVRFEGFVAPGKHTVSVRVDAEAKDDTSFTTQTESTMTIDVPARRLVVVRAQAVDNGDMGFTFPKKGHGSTKLHLDVDVESKGMPNAAPGK